MSNDTHPLTWDKLRPYEQQQGGYWLYGPDCDVYGNGKVWVPVARPTLGDLSRLCASSQLP